MRSNYLTLTNLENKKIFRRGRKGHVTRTSVDNITKDSKYSYLYIMQYWCVFGKFPWSIGMHVAPYYVYRINCFFGLSGYAVFILLIS